MTTMHRVSNAATFTTYHYFLTIDPTILLVQPFCLSVVVLRTRFPIFIIKHSFSTYQVLLKRLDVLEVILFCIGD